MSKHIHFFEKWLVRIGLTTCISHVSYLQVELWFGGMTKPNTPADPTEPYPYDRLLNLKIAFFEIFADHSMEPSQLDYVQMVSSIQYDSCAAQVT